MAICQQARLVGVINTEPFAQDFIFKTFFVTKLSVTRLRSMTKKSVLLCHQ